ncbi:ATP-binding protein [Roseimaritima sediminicola]|uniref:ATP-binding protein n=1 Tax=Roseimaritima sediminicola TaxID=2662066 RepID=UPI0012985391|nr:AAA family ATPase [Roseimaritima sediminicola]
MAKKRTRTKSASSNGDPQTLQRPPAEILFADELRALAKASAKDPKPPGWKLSPRAVLKFVLGDPSEDRPAKFVGRRAFLERCIVSLATNRGLMLIGEPGTAKSYLSELLTAAISGDSTLTIQGSAGTTEDNIRYSWNYALLVSEGPSENALVPAPLYLGMKHGKLVRFEEITRCALEIQDVLLSVLSDRVMAVAELPEAQRSLYASNGFNVIATANTRDRGVNEMSAALKRRFNFETVHPIADIQEELQLVQRETNRNLSRSQVPVTIDPELTELLVTTFRELRQGKTVDGKGIETPSTVLSTAEAVATGYAAGVHAYYYSDGQVQPLHLVRHLVGSVLKDNPDDLKTVRHYFDHVIKKRKTEPWQAFYDARDELI